MTGKRVPGTGYGFSGSDRILMESEPGFQLFVVTHFLYANRNPSRTPSPGRALLENGLIEKPGSDSIRTDQALVLVGRLNPAGADRPEQKRRQVGMISRLRRRITRLLRRFSAADRRYA
jgi:hypothetical protein